MQNEQEETQQIQLSISNLIFDMYNDNYRQISSLLHSNTRISDSFLQLLIRQQNNNTRTEFNDYHLRILDLLKFMHADNNRQINLLNETNSRIRERFIQFIIGPTNTTPLPNEELRNRRDSIRNITTRIINNLSSPTTGRLTGRLNNIINEFFEPINIYPTEEQINRAVRSIRYRDIINPTNTSCPISLEPFESNEQVSIIIHCNHIFKTNHLNRWFQRNHKCPVCRYDIRTYRAPSQTQNPPPQTPSNFIEINNEDDNNHDYSSDDEIPDLNEVDTETTTPNRLSNATTTNRLSTAINSFINSNEADLTDPVLIVRFLYNL
jgi:hypothetical protein